MRIPLELLRIVLHQAEKLFTVDELFKLRLVSRTFNEETLFIVVYRPASQKPIVHYQQRHMAWHIMESQKAIPSVQNKVVQIRTHDVLVPLPRCRGAGDGGSEYRP